ncbi:DUF4406 domain-containing protein [Castellaniella sp. UC4442_H9]
MSTGTELIYLAGPMTGRPGLNHESFDAVAAWLRALGRNVVNPTEFGIPVNTPWPDCMRVAVRAVSYCSEMLMLPGWEHSKGATKEAELAQALGMRVSELELELIAQTLQQPHGGLPLDLVASTITALIRAQLKAGQSVDLHQHTIFPIDGHGDLWGTNPWGQDFLLDLKKGDAPLEPCLRNFIVDLLQGGSYGLCPPEEYLSRAKAVVSRAAVTRP